MRRLFPLSLFLAACTTQTPENNKDVVITGSGHSSASAEGFEKHKFTCCDQASLTRVVGAYAGVNEALAADNLEGSQAASKRLTEAAQAASQDESLSEEERKALSEASKLTAAWASDDLAGMRADLSDVNGMLHPMAVKHTGEGGDGPSVTVVSAFCPMAPGRWIQAQPGLQNPYYGAEMFTCGVFEPASVALK